METQTQTTSRLIQETETNPSSTNSPTTSNVPTPPLTPKPVSRSEPNPYPTTFVQADSNNFKQVVQMLTGSSETTKHSSLNPTHNPDPTPTKTSIPPIKTGQQKKQGFKLYERRNSLKTGLMINPNSGPNPNPTRFHEILSPSILDFPSLVLSPVTPLIEDPFNKTSPLMGSSSEEDRVIAEKGFYLHPSPRTAAAAEPQLLPLFPVTSPRVTGSSE